MLQGKLAPETIPGGNSFQSFPEIASSESLHGVLRTRGLRRHNWGG